MITAAAEIFFALGAEAAHDDSDEAASVALGGGAEAVACVFSVAGFKTVDADDATDKLVVVFHVQRAFCTVGTEVAVANGGVF